MRPTTWRRRAATALLVPGLALTLAACGGDGDKTATDTPTAQSPTDGESDATQDSETPAAEGEEVDAEALTRDMMAAAQEAGTAHMTMTMDLDGTEIGYDGDIDYGTTPPSMSMTMQNPMAGEGDLEIVFVDGVMYMNMGEMSQGKFYKMGMAEMAEQSGVDVTEQMDPMKQFEAFKKGLNSITFMGQEDIDGEQLDHYVISLDTSKIEGMKEATAAPGAKLPKSLDYDLWLDGDSRMRQMKMDMADLGKVTMKIDQWGEPVEIKAPPANQVMEMPGT